MATSLTALNKMKSNGENISMLSVYDASFARLAALAGIDTLLIGDSLGMVITGKHNTVGVDLKTMAYHGAAVARGAGDVWKIIDMPFLTFYNAEQAIDNARYLLQKSMANMVKIEGGNAAQIAVISALSEQGISVCSHLGLLPQTADRIGGYRMVGRDEERDLLLQQARDVERAGAQMLVLECVPATLAQQITQQLEIIVIGIGSGAQTDGQVLVSYDVIGVSQRLPYFAQDFLINSDSILGAFSNFHNAVKKSSFPQEQHIRN